MVPRSPVASNPKLQELSAPFLKLSAELKSSAMSSILVAAAYGSKVAKTLVLAPPQSASAFMHQLALEEGSFLSSEDYRNRFKSLGPFPKDMVFLTQADPSSPAFGEQSWMRWPWTPPGLSPRPRMTLVIPARSTLSR